MVANCTPVVNPPRQVPHSFKQKLHHALHQNSLAVVENKNGSLWLHLDPRHLNKGIKREHYKIPTIQEIASEFAGKTMFSTLDLKDGY